MELQELLGLGALQYSLLTVFVSIVVLVICREIACWYLKTTRILNALQDIHQVLCDISVKMGNERRMSKEEQKKAKREEEDRERYGVMGVR